MSNTKTVMGQASNQYVVPLDITDVFSTYLYAGNGSTQTITNGIDLAGEGGLVWLKSRSNAYEHQLHDSTASPVWWSLNSNNTAARSSESNSVNQLNSDGFVIGGGDMSVNGDDYVTWTFRKAPKFFDVVTYTGTGSARTISHDLGTTVGSIIVKRTDGTSNWIVFHKDLGINNENNRYLRLNTTDAQISAAGRWNDTFPTSTEFSLGTSADVNASGGTYVAYLFAHNDGDGEFGPNGDQDIIKCGSYTGNGSTTGPEIDLGFEPQWVLVKSSTQTADWTMYDNMRGAVTGTTGSKYLHPNKSDAEATRGFSFLSNGFQPRNYGTDSNTSGQTYIYIAIRRGPLAPPESGTEVFAIDQADGTGNTSPPQFVSGFPVDMAFWKNVGGGQNIISSRLTQGRQMETDSTGAEGSWNLAAFDFQNGWWGSDLNSSHYSWMWKRAPGFFDVVAYTGNSGGFGSGGQAISHNLGYVPEMIWTKERDGTSNWFVYHKDLDPTIPYDYLLNLLNGAAFYNTSFYGVAPTEINFTVGQNTGNNELGKTYIAYLFASLDGVSKVGSYTGTGSAFNVDCGFTAGARFVLIKKTSGTGDWGVFDTARGITDSSSPLLRLNNTTAEANFDYLDPYSGGFAHSGANLTFNAVGAEYIFYAIA